LIEGAPGVGSLFGDGKRENREERWGGGKIHTLSSPANTPV